MQTYRDVVANRRGVPVAGASVLVKLLPDGFTDLNSGTLATIYDGLGNAIANPITSTDGSFAFAAANGKYSLTVSFNGSLLGLVGPVELYDPADAPPATLAQLAAVGGAALVSTSDGATVQAKIDANAADLSALQLADYTALRAYAGPRKSVYVTGYLGAAAPSGIAGMFVRDDSDTTTADNGGTVIVASNGKRWKRRHNSVIRSAWFGTVADWNGTTGTNNVSALTSALNHMAVRGGGVLVVDPGDYYFGSYSTSASVMTISGLSNTTIHAYGARFIATSAAECTPFLLVFDAPNNVVLAGARFLDAGFNSASWLTHSRWGMAAVALTTSVACSGFKMVDCHAANLTYLLLADHRTSKRLMKNIAVQDCEVNTAYYGVDVLYIGDNLKVDNLICTDVRRGLISYGLRNADIDIKLYANSGFGGSNAFIELACEGETYDDGNGVLGANGNVENVRVKLNVTGYEGHENYVHFYNEQADSTGSISNVKCDVRVNNLSAVGKNVGLAATNIYRFSHELPNTSILASTSRLFRQIDLDGALVGTITGVPISVVSVNTTTPATVSISPSFTSVAQTYTVNTLTNPANTNILTPFARALTSLVPLGGTSAGTVTGLASNGAYTKIGKCVTGFAQLSWTGHTGTGQLRIGGLPFPIDATFPAPAVTIVGSGLSHTAGAALVAVLGGAGNTQILIYEESAGNISSVNMDTAVSALYVSFTYFTP